MSGEDRESADIHCMERLKDGDDLALNDLMARWKQPLVSFCLRYTGNHSDARDIAQESVLRFFRYLDRFDADIPQVDLGPFLYGNDAAGPIVGPAVTADLKFTEAAYDNLRWALGVPKTERLLEIKRRREASEHPDGPGGTGTFER